MTLTWTKSGSRATLVGMRDTKTGELRPLTVRDIVEFQGAFKWGPTDVPDFRVDEAVALERSGEDHGVDQRV